MSEEKPISPQSITREELYQRVWETPMSRLAKEFGISDVGLAKTCKRLDIPYPPRGWWARKAVGQNVIVTKLPNAGKHTPATTTIYPTPVPTIPAVAPEVQKEIDRAISSTSEIVVPEKLSKPHAVVVKWIADHEKSQQEARADRRRYGMDWPVPADLTPIDRRRHRIYDAIFKALEKLGGKIAMEDRGNVSATLSGEKIEFRIIEKQKQVRTPRENGSGYHQELVSTGKLLFKIDRYLPNGFKREWLETDDMQMDDLLPEIVGQLMTAAPLLAEQTRKRAENEHRRREAERQQAEEEERRKIEANRWRRFVEIARMWDDANLAMGFVEQLRKQEFESGTKVGDKTIEEWLTWSEDYAKFPVHAGIEAIFKYVNLKNAWSYRDASNFQSTTDLQSAERAFWAGRNSSRSR